MTHPAPARSVEIELKFDVDENTPLPDLSGLPGVATVDAPEPRELDARYLDTADAALARAGVALRRRTGGPDAGWHIKGPVVDGGRTELQWPLEVETSPDAVPGPVAEVVAEWTTATVAPLARIQNARTATHLRDADGGVVAEFVDDHVTGTDVRAGVERSWREWELELGPAAPTDPAWRDAFFAAAARAALTAGARGASSASKLARTLGH